MKIKLALIDKDSNYLSRIVTAFNIRYAEKLEIYSFTEPNAALQTISDKAIDVLIASDQFDIDIGALPKNCGFAYFVDSAGIDTVKDKPAICKFQKADLIFKQILSLYSETSSRSAKIHFDDSAVRTSLFVSASGGVGCSTVAAACAAAAARQARKVLFLSLEGFGDAASFFSGDGQFTLADVIYAVKGHKSNLSLKLESALKQDASGVYFYSAPEVALDITDLSADDIKLLLREIRISGLFDYVVITVNFDLSEKNLALWKEASNIVFVSDGSDVSNLKFDRMFKAIQIMEQQDKSIRTDHLDILYNKFSSKTGKTISGLSIKTLGGIPRFEHASTQEVIEQISGMEVIKKLACEKEV